MPIRKAYFLDADYVIRNNETYARFLLKGKKMTELYYRYDPYFYVSAGPEKVGLFEAAIGRTKDGEIVRPLRIEVVERLVRGKKKTLLKIYCKRPKDVPVIKQAIGAYTTHESNILFGRRVMMDLGIVPFSVIKYERKNRLIKRIISVDEQIELPRLSTLSFDIETYNPVGAPRERKDPVLMISWSGREKGVLTYKKSEKKFVTYIKDEQTMLKRFCEIVQKEDPDIIFGYNSGVFDLPYLQVRAEVLKSPLNLSHVNTTRKSMNLSRVKKGLVSGIKIPGRIHIDLYPVMRLFGFIGVIKVQDFTLGEVSKAVLGRSKLALSKAEIWKAWDEGNIEELVEYSMVDALLTKELGDYYLPLLMELSKIGRMGIFDTSLSTSGQLVESLLMFEATKSGAIIPSRPTDSAIRERMKAPIQGAFVKLPAPGVYSNIAVLDFRGMYPSIIVSYNIDPFTLIRDGEDKDVWISPTGARFLKKEPGLIPTVLERLIALRGNIKHELKKCNKESKEWHYLSARSNALKIFTNSFYGYLGYARSRWYSRECAESTTAWGRKHIHNTIEKAEKAGFVVLYGDTDSIFLIYKDKKDVLDFLEKTNRDLPGKMELELEGFYPRGVFVSKKAEEQGAKKKYALLGDDGKIKIRGFELVRRDWSEIAKKTQYNVLEVILKEGNIEKAVKIVRDAIERVKSGKVSMDELAIETQINKEPDKYEVKSPELAAAAKGAEHGLKFEKGSIVSYVITKTGKTISERAQLAEFATDYDPNYYINNQILPAVLKILKELGYDEDALKIGGKQKGLDAFF